MEHHEMMMRRPSTTAHEAALRSVQKPPSKPWRAGGGLVAPTPHRVYRVEPREFRDLVQRLTGAPAAAPGRQQHAAVASTQPVAVRAVSENVVAGQMYAPWCPFPLIAPGAPMHPASTATSSSDDPLPSGFTAADALVHLFFSFVGQVVASA